MRLCFETPVPATRARVFDFFEAPGSLATLMRGWPGFRVASAAERIREGLVVRVRVRFGPVWVPLAFQHGRHQPPRSMRERLIEGPFAKLDHIHEFVEAGGATVVRDVLDMRLSARLGGELGMRLLVAPFVRRMFAFRSRRLAELFRACIDSASEDSRRSP